MKKLVYIVLAAGMLVPSAADAAWWKPSTWKMFQKETADTSETASSTESVADAAPTIADLYKRISELEDKLQEAQTKLRAAGVKESEEKPVVQAKAASSAASSSDKEMYAKIKPALVTVETATSSVSGVVIDGEGHVLAPAYGVWIEGADKSVTGIVETATVILSSGAKKSAKVIGIHEELGLAALKIVDKGTYPSVPLGSQSAVKTGERAFVAGLPSTKGGTGGEGFLSGAVSRVTSGSVEVAVDKKPLDNGQALFDRSGAFIGIAQKATCKVLEEMKTCLKYSVAANSIKGALPKVLAGMRLFKDKSTRSAAETLVRGQIEGVFNAVSGSSAIDYAFSVSTGKNSFDSYNSRLASDQDGKITKIYLNKLKIAAQGIYSAMDQLKAQAHAFNVFAVNEESALATLDPYQTKVFKALAAQSFAKEKEYEAKVALWSRKKNEYDSYLANPSSSSYNYLLEESGKVEDELEYLSKERAAILDSYSGESIDIF